MTAVSSSADTAQDRREFASRKAVAVLGAPVDDDSVTGWVGAYLAAAVHGVRSAEVAGKVARHLDRFAAFLLDGFGHDRIGTVTGREVALWRDQPVRDAGAHFVGWASDDDGAGHRQQPPGPPVGVLHLDRGACPDRAATAWRPDQGRRPAAAARAPEPRALNEAQLRTVKNVLDRLNEFHRLKGRRHQGRDSSAATHRHARPYRDRPIVHLLFGTGLRRAEVVSVDLAQLYPNTPGELRRVKKARLAGVRGKGHTTRSVFVGLDARTALADYLETERPGDPDAASAALLLAAASIATRRPGGRLSARSINTIVAAVGRIHNLEVDSTDLPAPARCAAHLRLPVFNRDVPAHVAVQKVLDNDSPAMTCHDRSLRETVR